MATICEVRGLAVICGGAPTSVLRMLIKKIRAIGLINHNSCMDVWMYGCMDGPAPPVGGGWGGLHPWRGVPHPCLYVCMYVCMNV